MSNLPPLAAIRVFEAAARLENFTAAAGELGMTQAAVSYQIKLLEERLGVTLFQRTGRKVALTDRARILAPKIIKAFDQMRDGFAALAAEDSTILTISCTNSFASLWLAPRIGAFQMRHPNLAVRLHNSDRMVDFARDGIDLAVRGGGGEWPGLESRLLMRNRIAPFCSPAFLARFGPVESLDCFMTLPRLSPDDIWWRSWFSAIGITGGQDHYARPKMALDSQLVEGRAALAGHGLAILNAYFWRSEIEAGLLVEPWPSRVIDPMSYWLVHPVHSRNNPKVKAFRDWISAEFAAETASDPAGTFLPRA